MRDHRVTCPANKENPNHRPTASVPKKAATSLLRLFGGVSPLLNPELMTICAKRDPVAQIWAPTTSATQKRHLLVHVRTGTLPSPLKHFKEVTQRYPEFDNEKLKSWFLRMAVSNPAPRQLGQTTKRCSACGSQFFGYRVEDHPVTDCGAILHLGDEFPTFFMLNLPASCGFCGARSTGHVLCEYPRPCVKCSRSGHQSYMGVCNFTDLTGDTEKLKSLTQTIREINYDRVRILAEAGYLQYQLPTDLPPNRDLDAAGPVIGIGPYLENKNNPKFPKFSDAVWEGEHARYEGIVDAEAHVSNMLPNLELSMAETNEFEQWETAIRQEGAELMRRGETRDRTIMDRRKKVPDLDSMSFTTWQEEHQQPLTLSQHLDFKAQLAKRGFEYPGKPNILEFACRTLDDETSKARSLVVAYKKAIDDGKGQDELETRLEALFPDPIVISGKRFRTTVEESLLTLTRMLPPPGSSTMYIAQRAILWQLLLTGDQEELMDLVVPSAKVSDHELEYYTEFLQEVAQTLGKFPGQVLTLETLSVDNVKHSLAHSHVKSVPGVKLFYLGAGAMFNQWLNPEEGPDHLHEYAVHVQTTPCNWHLPNRKIRKADVGMDGKKAIGIEQENHKSLAEFAKNNGHLEPLYQRVCTQTNPTIISKALEWRTPPTVFSAILRIQTFQDLLTGCHESDDDFEEEPESYAHGTYVDTVYNYLSYLEAAGRFLRDKARDSKQFNVSLAHKNARALSNSEHFGPWFELPGFRLYGTHSADWWRRDGETYWPMMKERGWKNPIEEAVDQLTNSL